MDSNKRTTTTSRVAAGLVIALLALVFTPGLRAQTFNSGGSGDLGDFANPPTITDFTGATCTYDFMRIDMKNGKVWARPNRKASNAGCDLTLRDITNLVFTPAITTFDGSKGVLEVKNFTLTLPSLATSSVSCFSACPQDFYALEVFFRNDANTSPTPPITPIIIRATGNVAIGADTGLNLTGGNGASLFSTFAPGIAGSGGPGGYRGGNGGAGGGTPSPGASGAGPGGGPGGAIGIAPSEGAKTLTTGILLDGIVLPAGDDLLVQLRGGSGGGGSGGGTGGAGHGGGGGGGAILIGAGDGTAPTGTITINGGIIAMGGNNVCSASVPGSGGVVRLVGATITGGTLSGTTFSRIRVVGGSSCGTVASSSGLIRLEAFNVLYPSNSLEGPTSAAVVPGKIFVPTDTQPVFLKFSDIRNSADSVSLGTPPVGSQDIPGRTGTFANVDVSLANTTSVVTVRLIAGPNTVSNPFPSGKTVTLAVAPGNPQQGQAVTYTAPILCPSPGSGDCTVAVSNVALAQGFVSMSAFTVVQTTSAGTLARMFPPMYQGEEIEAVRMETTGSDTKYVLIAKSGREFPYQLGGVSTRSIAEGVRASNP